VWTTSNQNPTQEKVNVGISHANINIKTFKEMAPPIKEKKAKKDKKSNVESSVTTGRLMKTGNVSQRDRKATLLGQLTEVIGEGAVYELYSEDNFYGTKQVMLKGWFAENDPEESPMDFKLICDASISKELRSAQDTDELNEMLDSLEFANCLRDTVQRTTRQGEKMFDEKGEPLMEELYLVEFANNRTDMSTTRRTASGQANAEFKKEKKAFSFKAISGQF
jgi:hypothetical protein